MLVLGRKMDERIFLTMPDGRNIAIVITEIHPDKVRIGIEAPRDVVIVRDNAVKTIQRMRTWP